MALDPKGLAKMVISATKSDPKWDWEPNPILEDKSSKKNQFESICCYKNIQVLG